MSGHSDVVIVGTGHGGAQAAVALRKAQFAGTIALLGKEAELPYERPPLSKDYLAGERLFERLLIRPARFWQDRRISVFGGRRVVAVDPAHNCVTTDDGADLHYGSLVWAAGGVPRPLACPGRDLPGVHTVRTRTDVDAIRAGLPHASRVVVIGGGYIGLEVAAVLARAEKEVTVLEAQDRVLGRVTGEIVSRFYESEHRARGVKLRLGVTVERIEGGAAGVSGVRLAGGEVISCEMVIVGIGIDPLVEPLVAAGAKASGGVAVDEQCRTTLPNVFAIGDCALHANRYADGALVRLESVQNATDQATVVAGTLTGSNTVYREVPWFWSNQYELRLQTVGLSSTHDQQVLRGDPDTRRFSVVYLRGGRVIALDCVNATRDFVQGRRLVADGARVDPGLLGDASVALKDV